MSFVKPKLLTLANHKGHRRSSETITKDTDNHLNQSKLVISMYLTQSAGKSASEFQLVLVLFLIKWKSSANFLSQSSSVVDACKATFRHSNENRSILLRTNYFEKKVSLKSKHETPTAAVSFLEKMPTGVAVAFLFSRDL